MEQMKVVAVRLPQSVIDELSKNHYDYRSQSDYIRAGARLMAELLKIHKAEKVIKFYPEFGDVLDKFELGYHRQRR